MKNYLSQALIILILQIPVQVQLLDCVESLMTVADKDLVESEQCAQSVFTLLHTVLALQQGDLIKDKVFACKIMELNSFGFYVS